MQEEESQGPSFPRPWYYRPEYMVPMLAFWPSGALLIIRSPWNSNTMVGGLAWAVIIVGGVLGVRWVMDGVYQPLVTFYVPGFLLTLITQVQWTAYRSQMAKKYPAPVAELEDSGPPENPPRPSARRRRRSSRTGRSRG